MLAPSLTDSSENQISLGRIGIRETSQVEFRVVRQFDCGFLACCILSTSLLTKHLLTGYCHCANIAL